MVLTKTHTHACLPGSCMASKLWRQRDSGRWRMTNQERYPVFRSADARSCNLMIKKEKNAGQNQNGTQDRDGPRSKKERDTPAHNLSLQQRKQRDRNNTRATKNTRAHEGRTRGKSNNTVQKRRPDANLPTSRQIPTTTAGAHTPFTLLSSSGHPRYAEAFGLVFTASQPRSSENTLPCVTKDSFMGL